ncbi:TetR family transcriptional regulator [Auraticoccus sp. F435]|uniref:TetR family transcriptional regulator n=1 Tax=Auraticoccus cholistanensis TaxID=2656650 RepID=A0A6A9V021_9ACTN|nr:TetR/AcrR family transcriptional regulator [Auraticoccus cholistanensis]MVA74660.1 TetR family transcriptional regulator [Auraticoccus cholistanensis]
MSLTTTRAPGASSARRERTRQRLMEAAVRVVAERGVNGASVEEICERAGFTRGAFYSNFSSKEDLCLAVLRQRIDHHLDQATTAIDAADAMGLDVEQTIARAVDLVVDSQDADPAMLVTVHELRLHAIRTPEMRPGFAELEQQTNAVIAAIVNTGIVRHGCRLLLPAEEVGRLLGAVFEHGLLEAVLHGDEDVRPRLKRQMTTLLAALLVHPDARTGPPR